MEVRIETPRLIIREYKLSDVASIHEYASQASVVQYMNWGPNSYADTQQFLQQTQQTRQQKPRLTYELSIEQKDDSRQIGGFEIDISPEDSSTAMIGYILNPTVWHQGYATEVTKELVFFGFNKLNLALIRATCDCRNIASKRVLEKSGFLWERTLVDDFIQKGETRTTLVFTISSSDYTSNLSK